MREALERYNAACRRLYITLENGDGPLKIQQRLSQARHAEIEWLEAVRASVPAIQPRAVERNAS